MEFDLYWWFCVRVLFFSQESSGEKKEYLFKVLVIGDLGVGKTSIIKRYVHQFFSVHYRATISFARFKSTWKFSDLLCTSNLIIRLRMSRKSHLWDTSYCCDTHTHIKPDFTSYEIRFCLSIILILHGECVFLPFVFVCVFWHCEIIPIAFSCLHFS